MKDLETHPAINEQLYSRQLYVLGTDAMRKLRLSSMLVSGMKGLGVEIAKNLVLAGVGRLTLHDPSPACWMDLASQFFLSEKDIGQNRAKASLPHLAQLNSSVCIDIHDGPLTETELQGFQVVVLTDSTLQEQLQVGSLCHELGVHFLVASTRGLVGQLFCDFGKEFTIYDPSEAEPLGNSIEHISQGSPGILTVLEENGHRFQDGDRVTFSGIEGMTELNDCDPRPIRVRDKWTLEIGDTMAFCPYLGSGAITEVKKPQTRSYEALSSSLHHPRIMAAGPREIERGRCLHWAFQALHKFQAQTGRLPRPWDLGDANELVVLARGLDPLQGDNGKKGNEPFDEALVKEFAMTCTGDLSPINSVLGGIAAQEMLKAASGKFIPLDQWLYFDALECLPEDGKSPLRTEACARRDCRYDGQIAVFGADFQKKLGEQNYFLVGAGAIGCELLKTFAMVGLGAGQGGGITVTDMDTVELSNLSRQFLFRSQDLNKHKAKAAALAVKGMNPALRVTAHTNELGPDTEQIYGDDFFSSLDGVASALDTFQARQYVSERCVHYLKPMLESGTRGTQGSAAIFVPYLTQPYSMPPQDATETAHPICTLRYYPSTIEHTLQDTNLDYILAAANLYAKTHKLPGSQDRDELQRMLQELPAPAFQHQAHTSVFAEASAEWDPTHLQELLSALEKWPGTSLEPQLFEKDDDSNFHMDFIVAASNLRAKNYGIPLADRRKSKKIVGRIIPAIATTTAVMAGLMGLELYKIVMGHQRLSSYRHSSLHLAVPQLSRWIPEAASVQQYRDMKWTSWDRLTVSAPAPGQPEMTLKDLLTYLQEKHHLPVTRLLLGPHLLYSRCCPKAQQNLQLRVTELVRQETDKELKEGQKELVFRIICEGEDLDTTLPPLHYCLR
ncbi:ubiquitin-like modifier-activating enzyme 7 [Gracilinanus agilis]|uniref:ubiquitin-like modifier-activating enzyme 7 n=1 Tax=Gracilinanus agilis TaxID=191870 RepID=UPI001CFDC82D|nr:ubiquitin-like modifier-activating enzyme 7 [Gracilinanus agilis]